MYPLLNTKNLNLPSNKDISNPENLQTAGYY